MQFFTDIFADTTELAATSHGPRERVHKTSDAMRADNCLKHPAFSDGLTDNNPSGSSPEDG
jgi:hypothetical protein